MILRRAIIVCALIIAATPVSAQPAESQAEALYNTGRALVAANKLAEACAAFEQSQRLEPATTTLIALATCREMLGQLATARELFLEAGRRARSAGDRVAAQLHAIALERAAKLERRVPKLTISVPDQHRSARLEILRDQERIPATMWNREVPVDGGTYTITARAPGMHGWSTRVTLATESDSKTVDIPDLRTVEPAPDERPPAPTATTSGGGPQRTTPASAPPLAERRSRSSELPDPSTRRGRALPIAVGAGAVALLVGALGVSLWSDSTYYRAKVELTDQARRDSLYDSSNRQLYVAQGLAIAGAGCAGAAVWLSLRRRSTPAEASSARAGHLRLTPLASGIGVAGEF